MEMMVCIGPLHKGLPVDKDKFGHKQKACRDCKAEYNRLVYSDPSKREVKKALNRAYKKANRESVNKANKVWRVANPDKEAATRKRYESKITTRLNKNLINRIKNAFGLIVKKEQIPYYLGCDIDQWMVHLKKGFTPGMGWVNYGQGKKAWEIDHIMPLSRFGTSVDDMLRALHYTNTRPLWGHDNRVKGAKVPAEMPEAGHLLAA